MSNYPPDPGGVFATDTHRRVAGHLPAADEDAIQLEALFERIYPDAHTFIVTESELGTVLGELVDTGHARFVKGENGYKLAKAGTEALTGPVAHEPAPLEGEALAAAEVANEEAAEADAQLVKHAAQARVDEAKADLKASEAAAKEA